VVADRDSLVVPTDMSIPCPVGSVRGRKACPPEPGNVGRAADVVLMPPCSLLTTVEAPVTTPTFPQTSQSPAVSEILVTLAPTPVVSATADPVATLLETNSPTLPALALLFVVVPTMPAV
jgi:hypothetical protein